MEHGAWSMEHGAWTIYIYLVDVKNYQGMFFRVVHGRFVSVFCSVSSPFSSSVFSAFSLRFLCVFYFGRPSPGSCPAEISWREARILEYGPLAAKAVQEQIHKAKC